MYRRQRTLTSRVMPPMYGKRISNLTAEIKFVFALYALKYISICRVVSSIMFRSRSDCMIDEKSDAVTLSGRCVT